MIKDKTVIETIGTALFGDSWMSQIAKNLNGLDGNAITRQAVQNWHRSDRVPLWAKNQLSKLAKKRLNDLIDLNNLFDNYESVVNSAIEHFLWWNQSKLDVSSVIYCKLTFETNDLGFDTHQAIITLDQPDCLQDWHTLKFEEKYFIRDMINIRDELKKKLSRSFAVSK